MLCSFYEKLLTATRQHKQRKIDLILVPNMISNAKHESFQMFFTSNEYFFSVSDAMPLVSKVKKIFKTIAANTFEFQILLERGN